MSGSTSPPFRPPFHAYTAPPRSEGAHQSFDLDSSSRSNWSDYFGQPPAEHEISIGPYAASSRANLADPTAESLAVDSIELPERIPRISRPPNAFILYRSDKLVEVKEAQADIRTPQAELSKLIAERWRQEPPEVRYSDLRIEY